MPPWPTSRHRLTESLTASRTSAWVMTDTLSAVVSLPFVRNMAANIDIYNQGFTFSSEKLTAGYNAIARLCDWYFAGGFNCDCSWYHIDKPTFSYMLWFYGIDFCRAVDSVLCTLLGPASRFWHWKTGYIPLKQDSKANQATGVIRALKNRVNPKSNTHKNSSYVHDECFKFWKHGALIGSVLYHWSAFRSRPGR